MTRRRTITVGVRWVEKPDRVAEYTQPQSPDFGISGMVSIISITCEMQPASNVSATVQKLRCRRHKTGLRPQKLATQNILLPEAVISFALRWNLEPPKFQNLRLAARVVVVTAR